MNFSLIQNNYMKMGIGPNPQSPIPIWFELKINVFNFYKN